MNTIVRLVLCVLAVGLCASWLLPAEPAASQGRVLLLENGRALEGDIRAERDGYCVKRATGEIWLPGNKVVALCASWEKAVAYIRSQANLEDPDEHLRLARWCQAYGLRAEALAEANVALKMRPGHVASKQFVELLKRQPTGPENKPAPQPQRLVSEKPAKLPPAIDLSTEALGAFASRVQPVLMNTCASCHAGTKATTFKLQRSSGNNQMSRRATQQNIAAVVAQIDPARPAASPLLLCAVTDHGKAGQAPLKAQSPPYRILQDWIQLTLATNPFLRERAASASGANALTKAPEPVLSRWSAPPDHSAASAAVRVVPVVSQQLPPARQPNASALPVNAPPATGPVDDFDPLPYNRQFHPERQAEPAERGASVP
jgi:hypothetical protein